MEFFQSFSSLCNHTILFRWSSGQRGKRKKYIDLLPILHNTGASFLRDRFYLKVLGVCNTGHAIVEFSTTGSGLTARLESKQKTKARILPHALRPARVFNLVLRPGRGASTESLLALPTVVSLFSLPLHHTQGIKRKSNHEARSSHIGYSLITVFSPRTCYHCIHFSEALDSCFLYFCPEGLL